MAVTLAQFVQNLVQSGLFTSDELAAFQQNLPADRRPRKPQNLARELHKAGRLTKYQAAQVFQGKTKGLVLGDYVIQDEIGAGGMGQVFKAWRRDMERNVALKILPARAMGSPEAVERFRREVKAAARLEHPNIVTAYDTGEAEGVHFLVMQYIDGKDLAHVVAERGPLPVDEAVDCVTQAARGLESAHKRGVIHRDIKPGNLLLDQEGTVRVLDMGLARIDESASPYAPTAPEALTESGQVMGTYDYMAPEQAEDTHAADHRADVYSLGCTLFRLLTDRKPYQADTPIKTLLAHLQAPIPSLCELRGEVSPELEAVVQKMLAKAPAQRQQSMGEVIVELEGCIRSSVSEPPTPPPVGQPATASSSSSDSALKAFLRRLSGGTVAAQTKPTLAVEETAQLQRGEETSVLAGRKAASAAPRKNRLPWLGIAGGLVAAVLILAVSFALLGRGGSDQDSGREIARGEQNGPLEDVRPTTGPSETCLLIQWPESERRDAKLEIDGATIDLASSDIEVGKQLLRIPTDPGSHGIWIVRRGFAPYEVQVAISEGESLEIKPEWGAAPGLVERAEAEPEPTPPEPGTQPTMPEPEPSQVAEKPPPSHPEPEVPEPDPEEEERLAAEQRYTEALAPTEELVAAWKFRDALVELGKVQFEEEDYTARLASRREQVEQLAQLKSRIIEALNTADPRVTKAALKIRGVGGEIVKADEEGVTAKLTTKTETRAWNDLGEQATEPLLGLVIDSQKPEDLLAAGLLVMACKNTTLAEACFNQARQAGVDIGPYLAPLAQTAFARARELLDEGRFTEAEEILANVEAKYAEIPWFAANRTVIAAARAEAGQGIYETEAEKLYVEAAELFEKEQFFDVKPLVEKLKTDYINSQSATDTAREPSFSEMEQAVANLGEFITVRQDGKGDCTSIQAAIDAAPPNSLIEIQDSLAYYEQILISKEKDGVAIRGQRGVLPVVTSLGTQLEQVPILVEVLASRVCLERIAFVHVYRPTARQRCISIDGSEFAIRSCLVFLPTSTAGITVAHREADKPSHRVENCVIIAYLDAENIAVTNSIFVGPGCRRLYEARLESCVFARNNHLRGSDGVGRVAFGPEKGGGKSVMLDCIAGTVDSDGALVEIEHCDVLTFAEEARPGKGCIAADPQFVNPQNLDYRLMPTSPCIGKASDAGDIGCRYTPEVIEVIQKALELRAQGIIKF